LATAVLARIARRSAVRSVSHRQDGRGGVPGSSAARSRLSGGYTGEPPPQRALSANTFPRDWLTVRDCCAATSTRLSAVAVDRARSFCRTSEHGGKTRPSMPAAGDGGLRGIIPTLRSAAEA